LTRSAGHLGLDYVPELRELAGRAVPLRLGALVDADTDRQVDYKALTSAVLEALDKPSPKDG